MQKYDFSAEEANYVDSLVYLISAVASPAFGFVIDKTGRNVSWILVSIGATIMAHSFLAFTYVSPYLCMVSQRSRNFQFESKEEPAKLDVFNYKIFFIRFQISMGLAYSMLASSLWPLVALIIPEYQLGTAYGM